MIRSTRTTAAALVCAALLAGTAACTEEDRSGSRLDSPQSGGSFAGGASPGSASAPAAADSGQGDPGRCRTTDLKADFQLQPQNPNTALILLTNKSSRTCTVYGYPGMAMQDTGGRHAALIKADRVPHPGPPVKITLSPGTTAFAGTRFTRDTAGGCDGGIYDQVLITPPDETSQLVMPVLSEEGGGRTTKVAICDGVLAVGSFQPSNQGVLF